MGKRARQVCMRAVDGRARKDLFTVQRTKLCRSELPANDIIRSFNTPRPFLLLSRVPILVHCGVFVTNFIEAKFRALYSNYDAESGGTTAVAPGGRPCVKRPL
ncbi:hypothetical protein EVAR_63932_1 [Eumeta japonica]|uniref:Uncharacterized protein n=1 Tax=Eumeta variegata TaxID=151549 RepID=A0A4C1ZM17_EUMVA|nr:hypothetical protein EVAR_63932_1 [Eumeta japonica]